MLTFADHPRLAPAAFVTRFPAPLGELDGSALVPLLTLDAPAPVARSEELRKAARDVLRFGGHRPTGRGKPSAEYLVRAAGEGALSPINLAVDACNAVSLASGIPISVVDLDRARAPFEVRIAEGGLYVFNRSGQEIDLTGLLCLFDAEGPCANAVKDSQRTKTSAGTTATLSVLWGPLDFRQEVEAATAWYRELLEGLGALTERVG